MVWHFTQNPGVSVLANNLGGPKRKKRSTAIPANPVKRSTMEIFLRLDPVIVFTSFGHR